MPLTATTFPDLPDGYDFGHNGCNGGNGFEYNGHQYTVLMKGGDSLLDTQVIYQVFKDLVALDSAHAPSASLPYTSCFASAVDGNTLYLIETQSTTTVGAEGIELTVNVYTFDLVSEMWTSGPTNYALPVRSQYRGGSTLFGVGGGQYTLKMAVRGPGDYIVLFSGAPVAASGHYFGRLYYATFDGSTMGTPVLLPPEVGGGPFTNGTPYYLGAGSIGVDSTGRSYFFAEDNSINSSLGPSLVLWTLTAGGTLSAAQVVDVGVYWQDVQGTISNSLVYTPSGGSETIAIGAEVCDDPTFAVIKQKFYTAPIGDTPTWSSSTIIFGADTWSGGVASNDDLQVPRFDNYNTQTMAIAHDAVANQLMVVWCVTRFDGPGGNEHGHFWGATSPDLTPSWSSPTLLFDSPDALNNSGASSGTNKSGAVYVFAYSNTTGIGIIGISSDESAQFYGILSATRKNNYVSSGNILVAAGKYVA